MIAVSARQTPFSRVLGNFDQHRSFKDGLDEKQLNVTSVSFSFLSKSPTLSFSLMGFCTVGRAVMPSPLSPQPLPQALPVGCRSVSKQAKRHNLSRVSWIFLRVSSQLGMSKIPHLGSA